MQKGLLPISQWALHFYQKLSYHEYNSLLLEHDQTGQMLQDLGQNYVMFLRNHGVIACGQSIHEAMFYTYHLEQACKTQCLACTANMELVTPSHETCEKTVHELLTFEKDLGTRDWLAWLNKLQNRKTL